MFTPFLHHIGITQGENNFVMRGVILLSGALYFGQTMESEQESGCSAFTLIEGGMARMGMAARRRSDLIVLTASSTSSPSVRIPSRIVSRVMPFSGIMVVVGEKAGYD